jgi:hypothetical protein
MVHRDDVLGREAQLQVNGKRLPWETLYGHVLTINCRSTVRYLEARRGATGRLRAGAVETSAALVKFEHLSAPQIRIFQLSRRCHGVGSEQA